MVERGVEEEAIVLDLEVLVGLADPALAQGYELLTLGERSYGHGPFFECNRHTGTFVWSASAPLGRI
jgi:hypothetical protein